MPRLFTRTGTSLLGLVKHLSIGEARYFLDTFDRPFTPHLPWWGDDAPDEVDLWVTASESSDSILGLYAAATARRRDDPLPRPRCPGHVPWWPRPNVTLHAVRPGRLRRTSSVRVSVPVDRTNAQAGRRKSVASGSRWKPAAA